MVLEESSSGVWTGVLLLMTNQAVYDADKMTFPSAQKYYLVKRYPLAVVTPTQIGLKGVKVIPT